MSNAAGAFCRSTGGDAFIELPSNTGRACGAPWWVAADATMHAPDDTSYVTRFKWPTNTEVWENTDDVPDPAWNVYVDDGGEIFTGGAITGSETSVNNVVRLNKDGTVTSSFSNGRSVYNVRKATPDASDFYVLSLSVSLATIEKYNNSNTQQWDTTLTTTPTTTNFRHLAMAFDSSGNPWVVYNQSLVPYLVKVNASTGAATTMASGADFQDPGDTRYPTLNSVAIDSNDDVYVSGYNGLTGWSHGMTKWNSSGTKQWAGTQGGGPLIVDASDRLFLGTFINGRVQGINTSTGATLWTNTGDTGQSCVGMDYRGDQILVSTQGAGNDLYLIDSTDGTEVDSFTTSQLSWGIATYKG